MIVLHIENSYSTWLPHTMKKKIQEASKLECGLTNAAFYLNRTYCSMYVEWWLHNIGYYLTLPFNKPSFIPL